MTAPPQIDRVLHVESELEAVRNEHRWKCRTDEGEAVVLAQLLPELAADESLRRRYVYEAERLASIQCSSLAEVLAVGPKPDPRDPKAAPPWRLRLDPKGVRLDRWLSERSPVPPDEGIELLGRLAEAVHSLNLAGVVLRDLEPRSIVLGEHKSITITDVGLARVDILSSRTASSLMLESSAYAAPEHLRATVVDARADVYTLGAIAWQALTGVLPYDEDSPFLRKYDSLPNLAELRQGIPPGIDKLLRSCLSEDPQARPKSAGQLVDILRGSVQGVQGLERVRCQACGEELRLGLRLCLNCGKAAVQFTQALDGDGYSVSLRKATEEPAFHSKLQRFFEDVAAGPVPRLNFLIGDARMYSKAERLRRIALPAALFNDLSKESAEALAERLSADGIKVKVEQGDSRTRTLRRAKRYLWAGAGIAATGVIGAAAASFAPLAIIGGVVGGMVMGGGALVRRYAKRLPNRGLAQLRKAPLALPASDPYVVRLASLLADELSPDVREQVSELALLVQRLVDHRAEGEGAQGALDMLMEPLSNLVSLVCDEVEALRGIDKELSSLDEGHLIRAIAASRAREEDRSHRREFLAGLDRIRSLEDRRSLHMGDLLQASALLDRVVQMGLAETDEALLQSNRITMALAALGSGS